VVLGTAKGATISSGGYDYIESGGVGSGTVVASGAIEWVESGGRASGGTLDGYLDLKSGGSAAGLMVGSGGEAVVFGTASGLTVGSGGRDYVEAGGTANGTTISSGGMLDLTSGSSAGATPTTFAGSSGGLLVLNDSMHFGGLVAGFSGADQIDLADIPYVARTTTFNWSQTTTDANASGTLTVTDGGNVANITLLGQYQANQFALAADGAGTVVTCPPAAGSSTLLAAAHA
jgi:autotransporter passenger strand-loop-strand repeat protein